MATPSYVGQVGSFFSATSVSTQPMTTTAAVAVGDTLFVTVKGQGNYGQSCIDSVGNTYTLIGTNSAGVGATLFGCVVTVAMPIGTVITPTMTVAGVNQQAYAFVFRNVALSGPVVVDVSTATTTLTTTAVTPQQVNGIILSFSSISGNYGATQTTATSGFTVLPLTATQRWSKVAWKQMDSTTISSTSVVWTESAGTRNWSAVTCAFNATSGEFFALF